VLHAKVLPDNPYDGHTLRDVIEDIETLAGCSIERAYRGHDAQKSRRVLAASSVSSSANCAADPPSSPSSDT
jgi:hypothetical protein